MRKLTPLLIALVAIGAPASAEAARAVTYHATSNPSSQTTGLDPFQAATVTIRGDRVLSAAWFVQPFTGVQGVFDGGAFPGPPAYKTFRNVGISRRGTFNLRVTAPTGGEGSGGACLMGTLRRGRLSLASDDSGGCYRSDVADGNVPSLQVSRRPPVRGPRTFTGTATPSSVQSSEAPPMPPTGPAGPITLTLDGQSNISGTGSFAPVDPTTGLGTGGPAVNVTYASAPLLNPRAGIFQLNASVPGYDVCGVIEGNGTVSGLVSCQQGNYLPAAMALSG